MGYERRLDKAESAIQQTGRYYASLSAAAPGCNVEVAFALYAGGYVTEVLPHQYSGVRRCPDESGTVQPPRKPRKPNRRQP